VGVSGEHRVYLVTYRIRGRQRSLKIEDIEALTLAQARAIAKEKLALVSKGQDPAEIREQERHGLRVSDLVMRYITHDRTRPDNVEAT